jgi:hypothetical protein
MPSLFINDPKHWHERAKEMRALAENAGDEESKQAMLRIAQDYETLAQRALERLPECHTKIVRTRIGAHLGGFFFARLLSRRQLAAFK